MQAAIDGARECGLVEALREAKPSTRQKNKQVAQAFAVERLAEERNQVEATSRSGE
jgi:hypothetical protein